ncbi:DUF6111 family protein [uncultured Sneathiella sp.]|uniref:DUF6111 family protein n=1 Tax=uncultured Sneathiella sp. TaxID=879315 RepID=UPI0030EF4180|tara:strand:- start:18582 stop:18863 length:282 start_codon:yes stop_codon:yes gene_type:complete
MIRAILFHIIPLILPFVVYGVYLYFNARAGGDKSWGKTSLAIATISGLLLMAISLITLGLVSGESQEGTIYVPPRFEDGRIIDSQILPAEKKD